MPYATIQASPLIPGMNPVKIYYRETVETHGEHGAVPERRSLRRSFESKREPLLLLHGGWGYEMYPFARQIEALRQRWRILAPDRCGYGLSTRPVEALPSNFHYHAAADTLSFMDSLGIERAFFWGHSDGAVIAAILGFTAPARVAGLILEAFHYYRLKPASRAFFETLANEPEALGAELCDKFIVTLGVEYWRQLLITHAQAWLQIAKESKGPTDDLYGGRLHEVTAPTLFVHGKLDPRTEPGELDDGRKQLPECEMHILNNGAHSPHSEGATAELVTSIAHEFLTKIRS